MAVIASGMRARCGLALFIVISIFCAQARLASADTIDEVLVTGQRAREVVGAKTDVPLLETPQAISVVSAESRRAWASRVSPTRCDRSLASRTAVPTVTTMPASPMPAVSIA